MANRRERLEVEVVASDKASTTVGNIARAVDSLDGETAEFEVSAEDKATAQVDELMRRISGLTDEDQKVILTAEARKLENEVKKATILLGKVDGEKYEAVLDARNDMQQVLGRVNSELDDLDRRTADATLDAVDQATGTISRVDSKLDDMDRRTVDSTIEADDRATGDIRRVDSRLDEIDRKTVDATVDAQQGAGLTGLFEKMDALPGDVTSVGTTVSGLVAKGGPILALAAGLGGAALEASNTALEVDNISKFTGDSLEMASRLYTVWTNNGLEVNDLLDIVAQMTGVLDQSPEIARQLGLKLDGSRTPLQLLVDAVGALNSDQISANDRILLGSQLFGEEGVRQIGALSAMVGGDLQTAIDGVSASRIVDEEAVEKARDFKAAWVDVTGNLREIAMNIGPEVLGFLSAAAGFLADIGEIGSGAWEWLTAPRFGTGDEDPNRGLEWVDRLLEQLADGKPLADAFDEALSGIENKDEAWEMVQENISRVNELIASGMSVQEAWNTIFGAGGDQAANYADQLGIVAGAVEDNEGAAISAAEAFEQWRRASRTFDDFPATVANLAKHMRDGTTDSDSFAQSLGVLTDAFPDMAPADIFSAIARMIDEAKQKTGEYKTENYDLAAAQKETEQAALDAAEAHRDQLTAALEGQADALRDNIALLDEQNEALRSSADAFYAVESATEDLEEARAAARKAGGDDAEVTGEAAEAVEDYRDSVIDAVDAQQRLTDEQNRANGVTRSRVQAIDDENRAYLAEAGTVEGAMRQAILAHVLRLNGIPEERITEILADADPNDIEQVDAELNGLANKRRVAAFQADASEWSLEVVGAQLTAVAKTRGVPIVGEPDMSKVYNALANLKNAARVPVAFTPGGKFRATGDSYTSAGSFIVGEQGPELITLPAGSRIDPNRADTGAPPVQHVTNVTNHINVPFGGSAVDELKRYRRIQGPPVGPEIAYS